MAKKQKQSSLTVQGVKIRMYEESKADFVSLTDMASNFDGAPRIIIQNWMRTRSTVEFLGVWESLHNPSFNRITFDAFKNESGGNTFTLSPKKWIGGVKAIGMVSKAGRHGGGTYAHKDIAFEFCSWLSPAFKLYVIKEFQRLKEEEASTKNLEWNVRRLMAKANYKIHTEAVREHLIPPKLQFTKMEGHYFANEADLVNMALFGLTAKEWRRLNPDKKGNVRDHASPEQLLVLSNLQSLNAKLMKWDCDESERLQILNESAIEEMNILLSGSSLKKLDDDKNSKLLD